MFTTSCTLLQRYAEFSRLLQKDSRVRFKILGICIWLILNWMLVSVLLDDLMEDLIAVVCRRQAVDLNLHQLFWQFMYPATIRYYKTIVLKYYRVIVLHYHCDNSRNLLSSRRKLCLFRYCRYFISIGV